MNAPIQPPLCIDCKHFITGDVKHAAFERCGHPVHGIDLVHGKPIQPSCARQRTISDRYPGACGKQGRLFEEGQVVSSTALALTTQNSLFLPLVVSATANYDEDCLIIEDKQGNADIYTRYRHCPKGWGPFMRWHPSQYRLGQSRVDQHGHSWTRYLSTPLICNDFGDLVEAAK